MYCLKFDCAHCAGQSWQEPKVQDEITYLRAEQLLLDTVVQLCCMVISVALQATFDFSLVLAPLADDCIQSVSAFVFTF